MGDISSGCIGIRFTKILCTWSMQKGTKSLDRSLLFAAGERPMPRLDSALIRGLFCNQEVMSKHTSIECAN